MPYLIQSHRRSCHGLLPVLVVAVVLLAVAGAISAQGPSVTDNAILIDVTGSMLGYGYGNPGNIWPTVREKIKAIVRELPAGDNLALVPFATGPRFDQIWPKLANPSAESPLLFATLDDVSRQQALEYLDHLVPDGQQTYICRTLNYTGAQLKTRRDQLNARLGQSRDAETRAQVLWVYTDGIDTGECKDKPFSGILDFYKMYIAEEENLYLKYYCIGSNCDLPTNIPRVEVTSDPRIAPTATRFTETPTRTRVPVTWTPTPTQTPVPPTWTPTPTETPVPPTWTPTPTQTPVPPTWTPKPTQTPIPPTWTPTPTQTPIPPTWTPTLTGTPVPPTSTATRTPIPPTGTPTPTGTPLPKVAVHPTELDFGSWLLYAEPSRGPGPDATRSIAFEWDRAVTDPACRVELSLDSPAVIPAVLVIPQHLYFEASEGPRTTLLVSPVATAVSVRLAAPGARFADLGYGPHWFSGDIALRLQGAELANAGPAAIRFRFMVWRLLPDWALCAIGGFIFLLLVWATRPRFAKGAKVSVRGEPIELRSIKPRNWWTGSVGIKDRGATGPASNAVLIRLSPAWSNSALRMALGAKGGRRLWLRVARASVVLYKGARHSTGQRFEVSFGDEMGVEPSKGSAHTHIHILTLGG